MIDFGEKYSLAQDKSTSPKVLEELSKDKNWDIRYYVALNSNATERALIILSKDEDNYIRNRACHNKNCKGILREMVKIRLGEEWSVDDGKNNLYNKITDRFGYNRIKNRLDFRFLRRWEERYVHGLL